MADPTPTVPDAQHPAPHPKFSAFLAQTLEDPEVRAAYEAAQSRRERRLVRLFERYGTRFFRVLPSRERSIRRYTR